MRSKEGQNQPLYQQGIAKILQNIISAKSASKVVDENGEPLVVYHGTQRGGFDIFGGKNPFGKELDFWYFTNNYQMAKSLSLYGDNKVNSKIYEVFLNVKNPYTAKDVEESDWALYHPSGWFREELIEDGYDGLQIHTNSSPSP